MKKNSDFIIIFGGNEFGFGAGKISAGKKGKPQPNSL